MASVSKHSEGMSIARAAIRRPVAVWLAIIFCLFGGLWGLSSVGRLEDPSFTLKTALVFVPYPGATAEEVEEEVSDVIEMALQQMRQLDRVESKSMPGMAQIHGSRSTCATGRTRFHRFLGRNASSDRRRARRIARGGP